MPKISVVIPLYNQGHFLNDSVRSLQEQSFKDWEGIIVNDGSTDDSLYAAEKIVKRDNRFMVVCRDNGGLSAARNTGINHSNGEFISLLDSDDYLLPGHLEQLVGILESDPKSPMVSGRVQETNENFAPIGKARWKYNFYEDHCSENLLASRPLARIAWNNPFVPCAQLWRSVVIRQLLFDESLRSNEDWDILWRAVNIDKVVKTSGTVVAYYRRHGSSLNINYDRMISTRIKVLNKNIDNLEAHSIEMKCAKLGFTLSLMNLPVDSPHRVGVNFDINEHVSNLDDILADPIVAPFSAMWVGGALKRNFPGRQHPQYQFWLALVQKLALRRSTYQVAIHSIFEKMRAMF